MSSFDAEAPTRDFTFDQGDTETNSLGIESVTTGAEPPHEQKSLK